MADLSSDESDDGVLYMLGTHDSGQSDFSISPIDSEDEFVAAVDDSSGGSDDENWIEMNENDTWENAPFLQTAGPQIPLWLDAKPIDYFYQLFPERMFTTICEETTRYARQKGNQTFETSAAEIKAYVGILFLMGVIVLPNYRNYWSKRRCLRQPVIAEVMSRSRYVEISKYFHLNDSTTNPPRISPRHDKLHKVRPILKNAKEQFQRHYKPHQNIAVDEAMIKFTGRCSFLQYVPKKPCKWGIKAWAVADSESFYLLDFNIYAGKDEQRPADVLLGTHVVQQLVAPYLHVNHHVYFDNFFTSMELVEYLQSNQTYATGTVNKKRKGLPTAFPKTKMKNSGDMKKWRKGKLMLVTWQEKKRRVNVLTTGNKTGNKMRLRQGKRGQGMVQYPKPLAIQDYTDNYNAVDKSDQLRSYYGIACKANKWWKYMFWFLLDVTLVNAFILYTEAPGGPRPRPKSHLDFHLDVGEALIGGYTSRRRRSDVDLPGAPAVKVAHVHKPTRVKTQRGQSSCVVCSSNGILTAKGRHIQTRFECVTCGVALCKERGCFARFHYGI